MSRSEDVAAATTRRTEIVDHLLELLTGLAFTTKELQHYRFVSDLFTIAPVLKELCSSSTLEGRTELALAAAMCALDIACDATPPPPSERVLKRREEARERRNAEREFKQSLAENSAGSGKVAVTPKKVKPPSIYSRPRASLTPDQLAKVRKGHRERQARYRATLAGRLVHNTSAARRRARRKAAACLSVDWTSRSLKGDPG